MLFIPDIVSNYIKTAEEYNRVKRKSGKSFCFYTSDFALISNIFALKYMLKSCIIRTSPEGEIHKEVVTMCNFFNVCSFADLCNAIKALCGKFGC